MVTPFSFDGKSTKQRRKQSNKQEERLANLVGGRAQPGSGAKWGAKGDVRAEDYLLECKFTDHESFSVSTKLWAEIKHKAMIAESGRKPALQLEIGKDKLRLVVLSEDDYLELLK